jgi:hypothetical protein
MFLYDAVAVKTAPLNGPRTPWPSMATTIYLALREGNAIYRIAVEGRNNSSSGPAPASKAMLRMAARLALLSSRALVELPGLTLGHRNSNRRCTYCTVKIAFGIIP